MMDRTTGNWVLTATILASGMAFIDGTALNVAMPAMQRALNLTAQELMWVVNGYTLVLSALILLGGAMGDLYGRKKVMMTGVWLFAISSLLCGISPSAEMLIAARAFQGLGSAFMLPGSLSILSSLFPAERQGAAIGTWSMFSALTTILGPVLGGVLAGMGWWRAIFFLNLPLAALALWIFHQKVPESKSDGEEGLDLLGGALATVGLGATTYGFIEAPEKGWDAPPIWIALSCGGLFLVLFLWRQAKARFPMMPLTLFRSKTFTAANVFTLLIYGAMACWFFYLPLNLIQIQGYPEEIAGLVILPMAISIAGLARFSGHWSDRWGAKPLLAGGAALCTLSYFLNTRIGLTAGPEDYWHSFFWPIWLLGLGMGLLVAPLTTTVMSCVNLNKKGIASGINNTISRTAGVLAIAVIGSLAYLHFARQVEQQTSDYSLSEQTELELEAQVKKLAEAKPPQGVSDKLGQQIQSDIHQSFISAFHYVSWASAGLVGGGCILALVFLERKDI